MKIKPLILGIASYFPGVGGLRAHRTGGTDSARYCYSVWLRHLVLAHYYQMNTAPSAIAELGPGDSIGIGLAALLSGAESYYALDVVFHAQIKNNLSIFEALLDLFNNRAAIPDDKEFPRIKPYLDNYAFPADILTAERLQASLQPARIELIRAALRNPSENGSLICYKAPWFDVGVLRENCIDMIYSQAVLEHVDDLSNAYAAMHRWLKPGGFMSHHIDYKCHNTATEWNGHWTYSDRLWRLIRGKRPYLLNRAPHSEHLRLLRDNGFAIVAEKLVKSTSQLSRKQLAQRFQCLSDDDLTTSGAYLLSQKRI